MSASVSELELKGRRVRIATRPGQGPPLLLCNGIGASLDLLQPFVDHLDPSIPVIRFDVPGIGGSEVPRRPYTFATLSCLLSDLLNQLGHPQVDVLGISWGGGLALQFAFQNPRRCRRLVLVSTAPGWMMVPGHPRVLKKMITPRRYRDPDYAASVAASLYGGGMRDDPLLAKTILDSHSPLLSGRGYAMQLAAGTGWTSLPFLPLIRQKTLILAGDDDPIIPLINARIMARLLPRARLHVYHDGHLGLITQPGTLAREIAAFRSSPDL